MLYAFNILKLYAGLLPISGGLCFSSSPQDPSFATTSTPTAVAKGRNDLYMGSAANPPSITVNPAEDLDTLFEAGLVDIGRST